jgi:hypothetical protein
MKDIYTRTANAFVLFPAVKRVLDKAEYDHSAFSMMLADFLRDKGLADLPDSIQHALNSGDGSYRP